MTSKPSSPPCHAHEADNVYMGYASREEIIRSLNELLEAERAGARVALASIKSEAPPSLTTLMRAVRADEARWCAMLARRIRCLGDDPSRKTGSFRDKALAISNPIDRLAFLNRGQAWVVRKLEALMPRVRDEGLHGDLREMLDSHCRNIQLAETLLQSVRRKKGER